jgi:hypothetical protein
VGRRQPAMVIAMTGSPPGTLPRGGRIVGGRDRPRSRQEAVAPGTPVD